MRTAIIERLFDGAVAKKRVSHAYLLTGSDSQAKSALAERFALTLNCQSSAKKPCLECASCKKIAHKTSPDFITIEPQGKSIKIDQIRDLGAWIRFGPTESAYLLVIINDAQSMTREAANAFLKNLEEPPERVVFLLLAANDGDLPRTIASRCQQLFAGEIGQVEISEESVQLWRELFELKSKNGYNLLDISQRAAQSEAPADHLLEDLYRLLYSSKLDKRVRVGLGKLVLEALQSIKMNANPKLTLDWFCLKWGEIRFDAFSSPS